MARASVRLACLGLAMATAIASPPAAAQSLSTEQKNLINHLAQVMVFTNECPQFIANDVMAGLLLTAYGVDISAGAARALLIERYADHLDGMKAMGAELGCVAGYMLYGPEGRNVPKLLSRR
jgi:hypothetical protein